MPGVARFKNNIDPNSPDDDEESGQSEALHEPGIEHESLMMGHDADEFNPYEGINLPIVYNIHSNFEALHKKCDLEISSIGFQKLLQGG